MCGFAGVIAWDDKYRVTRDTLAKMSAAIAHRGPDGEGVYLNHEAEVKPGRPQVGLVHRRLAILDPDPRSNQPFTDGRHWLVFNGEIYNYRELRAELKGLLPNYEWRTDGDTEVLLASYAAWGEQCVEHLNGMFAIAIWDSAKQSLFLARDRMGQKPLYVATVLGPANDRSISKSVPYYDGERKGTPTRTIAFASEMGSLRDWKWLDSDIEEWALAQYVCGGYVSNPGTIYRGATQMPPGYFIRVSRKKVFSKRYFDPGTSNWFTRKVDEPYPQITHKLLGQAVQRQLVADVPLGCFLSGGIDSSVIALLMRQQGTVETFSIGFDDPRYDESSYAERVSKHLGTKHHVFRVKPDAAADLMQLVAVFGEPFADSSALPTHYLARETRKHVKVALSGDGGDELFGGYDRYKAMGFESKLKRVPAPVRQFLAGPVTEQLPSSHPKSVASRMRRFFKSVDQPAEKRYAGYMRLFDIDLLKQLWSASETPLNQFLVERLYNRESEHGDAVTTALRVDRLTYLPDDLLTKVDRCSMLHALEVRSPFMDHELVQFAAGLTTDQLLKGGPKRMLREAFAADLPDFVFKRKKMGFAVPIGEWFRTDANLKAMLIDHLFAAGSFARGHFVMPVVQRLVDEHMSERVDHSQRLYALLMLELWWKTVGSGQ